jgi:hypothetical protein
MPELDTGEGLDLDWFATDGDGHVGHFTTGGSGLVPLAVLRADYDPTILLDYLLGIAPSTDLVHDLRGSCDPPAQAAAGLPPLAQHYKASHGPRVVFLNGVDQVRPDVDAGLAGEVLASEGTAVGIQPSPRRYTTPFTRAGYADPVSGGGWTRSTY